MTAYVSRSEKTRAASMGLNHAADAGMRAQSDLKEEIVRGSRFVELRESHARSDMRRAVDRIDLEGLDQSFERQQKHRARIVGSDGSDAPGSIPFGHQPQTGLGGEPADFLDFGRRSLAAKRNARQKEVGEGKGGE